MMNTQPYKNKTDFDAGRFREAIIFQQQVGTQKPSGGTVVALVDVKIAKAVKLPVRDAAQLEITVGATNMNEDVWFVIRVFADFVPAKDMLVKQGTKRYTLVAIVPVDQPQKYWKLLCLYKNGQDQGV